MFLLMVAEKSLVLFCRQAKVVSSDTYTVPNEYQVVDRERENLLSGVPLQFLPPSLLFTRMFKHG